MFSIPFQSGTNPFVKTSHSCLLKSYLVHKWWGAVQRGTKGENNWDNSNRMNNKKIRKYCWKKSCLVELSAVTPSASTSVSFMYLIGILALPHIYFFFAGNVSRLYLRSPAPSQNPLCDLSCLTIGNYKALPGRPQGWGCSPLHIDSCMASELQFSGGSCSPGFMLTCISCIPSPGASL